MELKLQMQCMIHKYAITLDEIKRLEDMINIETLDDCKKYPSNWHLERFYYSGYADGIDRGKLLASVQFVEEYGIVEVSRITGISRRDIEEFYNAK